MKQDTTLDDILRRSGQFYQQGLYQEALRALEELLKANYQNVMLFHYAAAASFSMKAYDQAEHFWQQALQLQPNFSPAHCHLGNIYRIQHKNNLAEQSYRKALAIDPRMVEAHFGFGNFLAEVNRFDLAEKAYRQTLILKPDHAGAYLSLGNILAFLNRTDEAKLCYLKAIEIDPMGAAPYENLGALNVRLNNFSEAEYYLSKALSFPIDQARATFNRGLMRLMEGNLLEGWSLYEARYARSLDKDDARKIAFTLSLPQWRGEPLGGKSLVVWHEQGFGDVIQFARFISILKKQGAGHITFVCKKTACEFI